jgi:glycosyltransferase involved in cell wall biosynthesis
MYKSVTIAAYNRPDNLRMLIDSLRNQTTEWDEWSVFVRVDAGGELFDQVVETTQQIDFAPYRVFWPAQNEGVNNNTYWLMHHVFENLDADYNLYLEDDLLLSPDVLALANWYIENEQKLLAVDGIADIGALCLCKLQSKFSDENLSNNAASLFFSRAFVGWGFLMGQRQWHQYGKPSWHNSRALLGRDGMWDNAVAQYIRQCDTKVYNLFPALSRVTNTGREGVHFTAETYDRMMGTHTYQQEHETFAYYLAGVR